MRAGEFIYPNKDILMVGNVKTHKTILDPKLSLDTAYSISKSNYFHIFNIYFDVETQFEFKFQNHLTLFQMTFHIEIVDLFLPISLLLMLTYPCNN